MKKFAVILIALIVLRAKGQFNPAAIFEKKFSRDQLRKDFGLFRTSLEKIHPALYRYTSRRQMDSIFGNTYEALPDTMAYKTFYKLLASINSHIHCQHTAVAPKIQDLELIRKEAKMFPYEIMWDFEPAKAYAISDVSNEGGIKPGTEIVAIGGQPIQAIYDTLIKYLFADGYNVTSKQVRLVPFDFQHWYYFFIGRPDTFDIDFLVNGVTLKKKVAALTIDEYHRNAAKYIRKTDPDIQRIIKYYRPKQKLKPYRLEFLSGSTALLTLNEYGSLEFIEEAFIKIKNKKAKNLIIDVRQNRGGWDNFGFELFSYLIKSPARYYDSLYTTITDIDFLLKHTEKDSAWYKASKHLWWSDSKPLPNSLSEGLSLIQPKQHRFEGDVYVLMTGKSMSTTAEFTAATHYNNLATFIGEESGGAYEGGNGADFATVVLPNTGLSLNIPLAKYVMATSTEKFTGHGTIPHHQIRRTVKDFLQLKDPAMELALKLIDRRNK
jgi:hypothetical protein